MLEELRLAALEDRASAELDIGGGADLIAELEALVSAHPLRERLWAQLMTALYRSGRQGDALQSYQRARAALVEELGVEPGDELQNLHAMVLAHDLRLLGPTVGSARSRPGSTIGPAFIGRTRELELLDDAYRRATAGSIVRMLITGAHGMGKTRVLAELARHVQAAGGTVVDEPDRLGADPRAAPTLLVLDDLQRCSVADLARLSEVLTARVRPALVVAACVWDELSPERAAVIEGLFPDRLPLPPLGAAEIAQLVELYVPPPALAEALDAAEIVASAGVPLHLHAAASRYGERLFAERIGTSAQEIPDPLRRLAQSRTEVAEGVAGLARLRSLGRRTPAQTPGDASARSRAWRSTTSTTRRTSRDGSVSSAQLVARLVDAPLLAVVGASGSGKSSVVRAGLVAAIREGLLPGSERWRVVVTTPARQAPDLPPAGAPGSAPRTLLVVDQLEEMFTVLPTEAQPGYAEWLTAAAERDDVTVVAAIRSDYFARVVVHRRLADLMAANTVLVGAMSAAELRQAIEVPAAAADLQLEPGLATTIADDVVGEPGGLPLMSTALLSLWERGDGRYLSLADYRETGGVATAVARLAEAAYAPMTPIQQTHARRILLRLAEVDDAGEPIRRRVALAELPIDGDPDAGRAFEGLATGRLLTVSSTHAEVAHEALLREWPRLRDWLDDDEAGRRLRRHLVPAAAAWQSAARDPGELYRGQRLTAALDFMADHGGDLTDLERDFLRAGRDAAEAEAAAHRRSQRRLRSLAAGLAVVLLVALGAGWVALDRRNESARLAVEADVRALRAAGAQRGPVGPGAALRGAGLPDRRLGAVARRAAAHGAPQPGGHGDVHDRPAAGGAGGQRGWSDPGRPGQRRNRARVEPRDREPDVDRARPDGDRGRITRPQPGRSVPRRRRRPAGCRAVRLPQAAHGSRPAPDPEADRADVGRPQHHRGPLHQRRTHRGHRRDGRAGSRGGHPDGPHGRGQRRELPISDNTTLDAPTGRRFMAGADPLAAGRVTAWDADDGRVVWTSEEDSGTIASISPAGTALVLAHETGSVEHLDLVTGARRDVPSDPAVELVDLDWAPDGSSFAGATTEGTVTLWDAQTLEPRSVFRGHSGTVSQVIHSADGASLYASGFDGAVIAWDLTGTRGIVREAGSPTPVEPFDYSRANGALAANGSVAVSYRADGALALVDVPAAVTSVVPVEVSGAPAQLIVDPAGRYAALLTVQWPASPDGEIQVVDVASRRLLPNTIQLIADFTSPAAFAGDGRSILTADGQTVLVWDARSGKPAAGSARYVAREYVVAVAPDATGRIVAVGVRGGGVEVGDTATGALVTALVPPGGENLAVTPLSFSPDGRWLAGGSESGRVVVWDTATWDVARTWVAVQGGKVDSLAFTPDSRSVVAGGAGTASVWSVDPRTPTGMTLPLSALPSQSDVAVTTLDEGRTVVTLTNDKGVQLWAFSPQALLDHACDLAGRNLTPDEWSTALPNLPYAQTCPER